MSLRVTVVRACQRGGRGGRGGSPTAVVDETLLDDAVPGPEGRLVQVGGASTITTNIFLT